MSCGVKVPCSEKFRNSLDIFRAARYQLPFKDIDLKNKNHNSTKYFLVFKRLFDILNQMIILTFENKMRIYNFQIS
jgi:hypothetical protein